jgi:hypothetical protein
MRKSNLEKIVLSGTPLIGEGNIVDNKSFINVLRRAGIPSIGFYPNGPLVWLGRWFHMRMSMSTKKTMYYAFNSEIYRSSLKVLPLKWELKRAIKKAHESYPNAICFITSQNMMAEEFVGTIGNINSTIISSSDVCGKFNYESKPSERQQEIIYFVWSKEALDLYKNEFNLPKVYLIMPVDPKDAFEHIERAKLPFQAALSDPKICFIKLSGSGGDPKLINTAIISLWEKSKVRSIVFPGTQKAQRTIIKTVDKNVKINSSLDAAVFYNQTREMISNEQMILIYPSEQVKHITVLAKNNIFPKVVWLPPRGQQEVINLSWAIKKGFSGTICIPVEYKSQLSRRLTNLGVSPSEIEFAEPEKLSADHFKPSPIWQYEAEAAPFEVILRKVANIS